MDVLMIIFIISVMLFMSFDLSRTLQSTVVKPMERMMSVVRARAAEILGHVQEPEGSEKGSDASASDKGDTNTLSEIEILELALQKISKLVQISLMDNAVDDADMAGMASEEKGVLIDMMGVQAPKHDLVELNRTNTDFHSSPALAKLPPGVDRELLESWNLDLLDQTSDTQKQILIYFLFDSQVCRTAAQSYGEIEVFHIFHGMVKDGYRDMPYHNYTHACDVSHTVFNELLSSQSYRWLSAVETYALMIAALCHDLGHQGKTNPFLVEIRDQLAVRYNDTSPLENMHCARLFDICTNSAANVFGKLGKDDYKKARKVCIEAILHTDNANHFEMVKDIQKFSEMAGEFCDEQAAQSSDEVTDLYQKNVLEHNPLLWCELFLHMADISNPLKPFKTCHAWAWRVLDEFFDQGDEEKRLGIPVGMLNDRDKINRPGSQHGFINFLVAPLVLGAVRIFPGLHPLSTNMASNLRSWRDLWVEDANPSTEDIAKRDADVAKIADSAHQLVSRMKGRQLSHDRSPRGPG